MIQERGNENYQNYIARTEKIAAENEEKRVNIEIRENDEELLDLSNIEGLKFESNERNYWVRKQVFEKIERIVKKLKEEFNVGLIITDAFRSIERQKEYWDEAVQAIKTQNPSITNSDEINKIAAKYVAPPDADNNMHNTGGAVDVALYDLATGDRLDFSCGDGDYNELCYTDNPRVTGEARRNRNLLRQVFEEEGFVNYGLEWWHFSFGNKEWAVGKGQEKAFYGPQQDASGIFMEQVLF